MSIFLQEFSHFKAIYTDDGRDELSPFPFKLKSLMLPAAPLVWTLILLASILISVFVTIKLRAQDVSGVAFAVFSPLTGHTFSCGNGKKVETKLKFWYSSWALLSFLFGLKYANVVQSLTTFPKATSGRLTFRDLMENNFKLAEVSHIDFDTIQRDRYLSMGFAMSHRRQLAPSGRFALEQVLAERLRMHRGGILMMKYVQNFYTQVHVMGIVHKSDLELNIPLIASLAGRSIYTSKDELFRYASLVAV